jgi:hypothetical protein
MQTPHGSAVGVRGPSTPWTGSGRASSGQARDGETVGEYAPPYQC